MSAAPADVDDGGGGVGWRDAALTATTPLLNGLFFHLGSSVASVITGTEPNPKFFGS